VSGEAIARMHEWFWVFLVVAIYVVVTQWLLPKLGVPT
jgi:hypothetical protein